MAAKKKPTARRKKKVAKKRPVGRPREPRMKPPPKERTTLTLAKKRKAIAYLQDVSNNMSFIGAAAAAGVTYKCIWENRKKDPEFSAEIDAAQEAFAQHIREIFYDRAKNGMPGGPNATKYSDKLLLVLLRRFDPTFQETTNVNQKTEHSGTIGLPDLANLSPEALKRAEALLEDDDA